jgi:hypothetical protein
MVFSKKHKMDLVDRVLQIQEEREKNETKPPTKNSADTTHQKNA